MPHKDTCTVLMHYNGATLTVYDVPIEMDGDWVDDDATVGNAIRAAQGLGWPAEHPDSNDIKGI